MIIISLFILLSVCISGCGNKKTGEKPAVAVEVAEAKGALLSEGVEITGSLEPKYAADIKTEIPGIVKDVYVMQWVRVRKGQPLARIDVAETEALARRGEASVAAAKAQQAQMEVSLNRAEREEARMLKLKESGLATQQAVDDSKTETAAAKARVEAAKAQISVAQEDTRQAEARRKKGFVVSPMDGIVASREVNVGDLAGDAAANKPIFRIVDNRILNLTVMVPSADSARVKPGQSLQFSVDSMPGKSFQGKVMYLNPELSPADRSLKVIAEVNNQNDILKGGLFAKGRIVTGNRNNVVQVHRSVLAAWDTVAGKAAIFVTDGVTARQRPVRTGAVNGDMVEISEGLKQGERYVSRGGFSLKDGDRVVVEKAGEGDKQKKP